VSQRSRHFPQRASLSQDIIEDQDAGTGHLPGLGDMERSPQWTCRNGLAVQPGTALHGGRLALFREQTEGELPPWLHEGAEP
jgi:hypothetical protein